MRLRFLGSVCGLLSLGAASLCAQTDTTPVSYRALADFAKANSPQFRIIEQDLYITQAERDLDLQWTNPKIGYGVEDIDGARESEITLSKRFAMPWTYLTKRRGWNEQIRAAEFHKDERIRDFLFGLKSRYIELRLLREQLDRLDRLADVIAATSSVAQHQKVEGKMSGVQEHLIQMTLISLQAKLQNARQRQLSLTVEWKADIGINQTSDLRLTTEVRYQPVKLATAEHYLSVITSQPGLKRRTAAGQALDYRIKSEKLGFLPSVSLNGGVKKIDPDREGFTAGVSLSIPLFNVNGASVRKHKAEREVLRHETELYRRNLAGQIKTLLASVQQLAPSLQAVGPRFEEDNKAIDGLALSYREGWISVTELLSSVQIEADGMQAYYHQLSGYYNSLLRLEALAGVELVSFEPSGDK